MDRTIGYNLEAGGGFTPDKLNKKEKKKFSEKVSKGLKGKKKSEAHKQKLSEANKGNYRGNQNIPFTIDGIIYTSIGDASTKLHIPPKTIHNRLNSNNIKFKDYLYINRDNADKTYQKGKRCIVYGIEYHSATEASIELGMSLYVISKNCRLSRYDCYYLT